MLSYPVPQHIYQTMPKVLIDLHTLIRALKISATYYFLYWGWD